MYQDDDAPDTEREGSGVFRAFSGSVEAAGTSESEALDSLDRSLRSSSFPAPASDEDAEPLQQSSLNDTDHCPPRFQSMIPPALARDGVPDTVRAPRPSSLPALAFARKYGVDWASKG